MKVLMAGPPASGNKWLRNLMKKVTNVIEIHSLTGCEEQENKCKFTDDGYYFAPHGQIILNSIPKDVKIFHLIRDGCNSCASYIKGGQTPKDAAEMWNEFVKLIKKYPGPIYHYEDFVNDYDNTMRRFIEESGLNCPVPEEPRTLDEVKASEHNKWTDLTKEQQDIIYPIIKESLKEMNYKNG